MKTVEIRHELTLRHAHVLLAAALASTLLAATGCSSSGGSTGSTGSGGGTLTGVRGQRYCEILLGKLDGATVHVDVYNTFQLDDCPAATWDAIDPAAVQAEEMVQVVKLNGPRYWLVDEFTNTALVDPTPRTIGGLEMRLAGTFDLPVAEASAGEMPYSPLDVDRTTTWVYEAGKSVYELVDPNQRVFDMQSYSVQQTMQTEASLADLGGKLTLPAGWTFRTRTLDANLQVKAVNGVATVVQDDVENTYQLSQQTP